MAKAIKQPADYILPLYLNGLSGRMLKLPAPKGKSREILLIYGHHALLERWWGLVENLGEYGSVTMPDLPGLGGMDSFYKIGLKPDLDAYAGYLATFIKLRYKKQSKITIYAISFGFNIVTRMLQLYPELTKRIDLLISTVGFMHHDDFLWSPSRQFIYRMVARLFATPPVAFVIRHIGYNRVVIRTLTKLLPQSKHRFVEVSSEEFEQGMDFEVKIWRTNDVRTHWYTTSQFFTLDNTKVTINLPVVHVLAAHDHYFNNVRVEEHMRKTYKDYKSFTSTHKAHVPHIIANKKEMSIMIPRGLKTILSKKPGRGLV